MNYRLTIIIPTKDRPKFLERCIRYYHGYPYKLIVVDSSKKKRNLDYEQVLYIHRTEWSSEYADHVAAKLVKTPYAVFQGDDDLFCTDGIEKCINFLDTHPDYAACHGNAYLERRKGDTPDGKVIARNRYKLLSLESEVPYQRLKDFMKNYFANLFSIHRTEIWKEMYSLYAEDNNAMFTEILPGCISAIRGKTKSLNTLYLSRQVGHPRLKCDGIMEWITSPEWHRNYMMLENKLYKLRIPRWMIKDNMALYLARGFKKLSKRRG